MVLIVLAAVGVIAYLLPASDSDSVDEAAPGAVIPSAPSPEADAPPPGEPGEPGGDPGNAGSADDDAAAQRVERLQPPPDGVCIRLDSWRPNLADVIECDEGSPVFEVVWSGPSETEPPMQCHFGYTYARGPDDEPHKVCVFPRFTVDECYSIPVEGGRGESGQTMDEVAESLNATATSLPCDAPARAPNERVVRMLGEVPGSDPTACPDGLRYYLENGANSTISCLAVP